MVEKFLTNGHEAVGLTMLGKTAEMCIDKVCHIHGHSWYAAGVLRRSATSDALAVVGVICTRMYSQWALLAFCAAAMMQMLWLVLLLTTHALQGSLAVCRLPVSSTHSTSRIICCVYAVLTTDE